MTYLPNQALPHSPVITTMSAESNGFIAGNINQQTPASVVWPTANLAQFIPFSLKYPISVLSLFVLNGATATGNFDIGIYTNDGTRITSLGSTGQSGTNTVQNVSITPVTIGPGNFYLALVLSSASGTVFSNTVGSSTFIAQSMGLYSQASALPLPASATFATATLSRIPVFGLATVPIV